ncbi:MAG TPA: DsbE family thiol:disulfide interchange protein [Rhizomicrobium sp.]|jgi:cytochrome c biogenesis protein CcmG/thiol:disulfide interchange protein DsbE|nr:DsbE family thiol:disulfide interchange protein [Rhizomicrobium sp.]
MKRWLFILPVAGFAVLAYFLFRSLWAPAPDIIPSALLNKPAPRLVLPALDGKTAAFTPADLTAGHVSVINVFASWCAPCRTETSQLAAMSNLPGVALYGLVQKDKPEAARAFLNEVGNPFAKIARDDDGRASIEWGVYGVPETFVVDGKGVVRFKYVGPLTDDVMAREVMPAIADAKGS